MNINTKKYYDGLADLPIGGGVPEDRVEKAYQLLKDKAKESYLSHGSFSASPFGLDGIPHVKYDAISKLMVEFSDSELSVATEKLKEQEQEIERLKAENERLRGEGWISVEDRLPDIEQNVLVLRTNPTVVTHGYIHKRGHWIWSNMRGSTHKEDYYKITHWQPLPPPPKSK